jgi:hypothetical protein
MNLFSCFKEDFENTKGVIRSRTSKKDRQHNGQTFMVHGGNLVIREVTSKQKASAKFVLNTQFQK